MLKYGKHSDITEWVDNLLENDFTFVIQSPTRITNTTKTIIDNFILHGKSFKQDDLIHGSINTYITDHNAIILKIKNVVTKTNSVTVNFRPFNKLLIQNFNNICPCNT